MQVIGYRSTVDWDNCRIHVGTRARAQKYRKSGDVFRLSDTAQQAVACELVAKMLENPCGHFAAKETGRD
jgi:hypothetical protein